MSMYQLLEPYRYISIIGMEKNTGKTETLNRIIQEVGKKKTLGLSSIGRDGEEIDIVSNTVKPRIYIFPGTIIATARSSLELCDITSEILHCTGISTPLGEVIIVRALSAGYVDLAGGSHNAQNSYIMSKLKEFGCDHVILDGALSRSSSAVLADAVILTTGAALSPDINTVVALTAQFVQNLQFPVVPEPKRAVILDFLKNHSLGIMDQNDTIIPIDAAGIMNVQNAVKNHLNSDTKAIIIRTSVTDLFMENIIKHRKNFKHIECIIIDGTKCFLSLDNYQKSLACGIQFRVINLTNLLCVTYNPYAPQGNYTFDNDLFKNILKHNISIPVINIRELYESD